MKKTQLILLLHIINNLPVLLTSVFFWLSVFIVFYTYLGYAILVTIFNKISPYKFSVDTVKITDWPEVTLVVAMFNEEDYVDEKIKNTFELDYPEDKLHILFITDGSTDSTPQKIGKYPRIKLMHKDLREGKTMAINRAMTEVKTPFVVFCDANTYLNREAIKKIVAHYHDSKTAAVAGEKRIAEAADAAGAGEGFYWKYESTLKQMDARFYSIVGAAGELFSMRTELYTPIEKSVILDDFAISMRLCLRGYRVAYEPGAYAVETASMNMKEEQKRKIRNCAGGIQAIMLLPGAWNIFKHPRLSFLFISHRAFRWMAAPWLLPVILILNIILSVNHTGRVYDVLLIAQAIFYLSALIGWILARLNMKVKAFYIPYYFTFMNGSMYLGLWRILRSQQTGIWEKAVRK